MKNYVKYKTTTTRIDIDTGEILENTNIIASEYTRIGKEEKYKKLSEKEIEKILTIKYKHNGQTAINF